MTTLPERATARLIILDPEGRILLIEYANVRESAVHPGLKRFWFTPGGGIEAGETAAQAALREMAEEVGLTGLPLIGEVARRDAVNDVFTRAAFCRERYFLVRTPDAAFDTARLAETDQDEVLDVRWWRIAELERSGAVVIPRAILALAARLAGGEIPATPVDLAQIGG